MTALSITYTPQMVAEVSQPLLTARLVDIGRMLMAAIMTPSDVGQKELEERFMALIRKEESLISAICFSYSGSVAEYEDLRQDALINIWRGLPTFKEASSSRTWLYRVVLNSCVSTIRKQQRHSKATRSLEELYDILADEEPYDRERIATLHRLIAKLNDSDKAIILLWLDEASYDDIADVMGMPRNTIATRLHRIKERLTRLAAVSDK